MRSMWAMVNPRAITINPWESHGHPMGISWASRRLPMRGLWVITTYPWASQEHTAGNPRASRGQLVSMLWANNEASRPAHGHSMSSRAHLMGIS